MFSKAECFKNLHITFHKKGGWETASGRVFDWHVQDPGFYFQHTCRTNPDDFLKIKGTGIEAQLFMSTQKAELGG